MEGNHRQNEQLNFLFQYVHFAIQPMRYDVIVLNFDVTELIFVVRK
jgi:hypothetical protein